MQSSWGPPQKMLMDVHKSSSIQHWLHQTLSGAGALALWGEVERAAFVLPEKVAASRASNEIFPSASGEDGKEMQTDFSQLGMSGGWEAMTKSWKGRFWHKDKIMTMIKH